MKRRRTILRRWEKEEKMDSPFKKGESVRLKRTFKWVEVTGVQGSLIHTNQYDWRHWNNFIGFNQTIDKLGELMDANELKDGEKEVNKNG